MRIALIIQDMYRTGAQYVTSQVASGLTRRGHAVDVLVSDVDRRLAVERPDLTPFPIPANARRIQMPHARASRNLLAVMAYLRTEKPQVVVSMSSTYELVVALAAILSRSDACIVNVEHSSGIGVAAAVARIGYRNSWLRACTGKMLASLLSRRVDRVIAVSAGVQDALVQTGRYPASRISMIYNPVVDESFASRCADAPTHPWLQHKTMPVIVAAGAQVSFKGYDVLIRAFMIVRHARPCRLILFGEGPEQENLRRLAAESGVGDDIAFPGYTNSLPANLAHADLFVVSSHVESFSVVLVEALACGTPVVATNCPSGPPEILAGGKYGILVEPNNPSALAAGIGRVLDGNGIKPPLESWQPYCLDTVMDRYEKVLQAVQAVRLLRRPAWYKA